MRISIKNGLIFAFCILVIFGCSGKTSSESNKNEKTVGNNQDKISQPTKIINENPVSENVFTRDTEIYKKNLVSEFIPTLAEFQNATQYTIELEIGEMVNQITGYEEILYTNIESEALDKIFFMLIPNTGGDYLQVSNVTVNGKPVSIELAYKNSVLKVFLAEPIEPGATIKISMDFSETIPEEMGGNYGLYIFQDNILALDSFFPIIPVYDEGGWNVQDPPRNADLIFTDAAFFEVRVDAPKELVLVASGNEVEKQVMNDRQTITFVGGPQRDFYLTASPRYQSNSNEAAGVKITSYYAEGLGKSSEMVLETAKKALSVFSERYGQYPYSELDLVSTPMLAGGMEYSGAAAMGINLYKPGKNSGGISNSYLLESATAHEVAHQWFFNQVMNNQIGEPWLDEGLAQYLTYIYYLDTYGSEAGDQFKSSWEWRWSTIGNTSIPIGKPANDYSPEEYSAIIYGRAPLFILELEKRMGEQEFTRFLADYVSTYQWKTVNTQQFQSLAQKTCGCDLTGLFDTWWAFD